MKRKKPEGGFQTKKEQLIGKRLEKVFASSSESVEVKLDNFTKYIRRQKLSRLLSLYEIFKKVLRVKGSIVECGVYRGFSLMAWANMSSVLEPNNLTRRIYGFDTFGGFPSVSEADLNTHMNTKTGQLMGSDFDELNELIKIYDDNRFLGHVHKVQLIKGNLSDTVPDFIDKNKHLMVSLLFLDMDLFEPTKTALEFFYPRMPKGAILAFDELDNPIWPGETTALAKTIGINKLKIERMEFDPYIGFAVIK